jgi:hypothetical protein
MFKAKRRLVEMLARLTFSAAAMVSAESGSLAIIKRPNIRPPMRGIP